MKKNKNILKTTFTILCCLVFVNCNDDLDITNPNTISDTNFWKTPADFNAGLITVYGALQFPSISGTGLAFEFQLGDIGGTESFYPLTFEFRNLNYNDATAQVANKWSDLYAGIFRANQVIGQIQNADPTVFEFGEKEQIEGQARFLRAFYYFQLVHTYGGAVIRTKLPENNDDLKKAFSSIADVTSMVIIPDLTFAKQNLPRIWSTENLGRVTSGAATSLLGKTHLFQGNWGVAAQLFKEVIDSNIYSLTPNIMDNFRHDTEFNSESIFEVAFNADLNPGINGEQVDANQNTSGAEASGLATELGKFFYGGFNTVLPSYNLHELYTRDEVDPTLSINDGNTESRRMSASIIARNSPGMFYQVPVNQISGFGSGQSSYVKKHTNWYHLSLEAENRRSGINFRHIRLADVFLMYAEAVLNASGDTAEAIKYIDLVRARAGVITLTKYIATKAGKFPQLHISQQTGRPQQDVIPSVPNLLTHLRRVERPLELAFEGHRWKDLVRWGIVKEVYTEMREDEIWREDPVNGVLNAPPIFITNVVRPDYALSAQKYSPERYDYFPIPAVERETNDQLGK